MLFFFFFLFTRFCPQKIIKGKIFANTSCIIDLPDELHSAKSLIIHKEVENLSLCVKVYP